MSAEEEKRSKQEWLQNSEACNYVRGLFGSYKTRYLLAGEKIKLFNQRHELRNGELPTYRFISREVVDKILRDMDE